MTALLQRQNPAFATRLFPLPTVLFPSAPSHSSHLSPIHNSPRKPHTQSRCNIHPTSSVSAQNLLHKIATQTGLLQTQIDTLFHLSHLLLNANRHYNLTAIRTYDKILLKHVIDALTLLPILDRERPRTIIDVGSGAGFPGIVIAIARPHWHVTLLDSARKKTRFHDLVRQELPVQNTESVWGRAEEVGQDANHREQYDCVVARSVAEMRMLSELCIPLVSLDGCFLAQKSVDNSRSEILRAKSAIKALGGRLDTISILDEWKDLAQQLQDDSDDREKSIVVVRKVALTPAKYPRKPRILKKAPL